MGIFSLFCRLMQASATGPRFRKKSPNSPPPSANLGEFAIFCHDLPAALCSFEPAYYSPDCMAKFTSENIKFE